MTPEPRRLMVFGKAPEPGRAKTRLAPTLGEERAAELYRAFLDDAVAVARRVEAEHELWIPSSPLAGEVEGRYPDVRVRRQPEGDLGGKLAHAFDTAFAEGVVRAVVTGSDHPTLPASFLDEAFDGLGAHDMVLGPSRDGGYYAVGFRAGAWPRGRALFDGVPWSTPRVLDLTRRRAERLELTRRELPEWYDVDEPEELERLREDVEEGSATGRALRRMTREQTETGEGGRETCR